MKATTCSISSKELNTVYDGKATPAPFSFANGDYLKFMDSKVHLQNITNIIKTFNNATCNSTDTSIVSSVTAWSNPLNITGNPNR